MLKPAFQAACRSAIETLARETADGGPAVLIGTPWARRRQALQCLCAACGRPDRGDPLQGRSAQLRRVRREARVRAGPLPGPIVIKGVRIGIPICEDIWGAGDRRMSCRDRRRNPAGAERLALLARQRPKYRLNIAVSRVVEAGLPLIYINQVGGQDELVFDGASFALNADRSVGVPASGVSRRRSSRRIGRALTAHGNAHARTQCCRRGFRQVRLQRLRARLARLRRQEPFQGRRARAVRRHRFRAVRRDGDRRARARSACAA